MTETPTPKTYEGLFRTPMFDSPGRMNSAWQRFFRDTATKTVNTISQEGVVQANSIDLSLPYTNKNQDNIPAGKTYGPVKLTALSGGEVDLSNVGVIGQASSAKLSKNTMSNYSNNATVTSFDNGSGATIQIYGPGGPGTTWNQFIGGTTGPAYPAGSITAAYSTVYYVYFDGEQFHATTLSYQTLPDGYIFCGELTTVASGNTGGVSGGGGPTGNGGGGPARTKFS